MKKHKVKIPEGYEIEKETSSVDDKGMTMTIHLKPIKKELPKTWNSKKSKDIT